MSDKDAKAKVAGRTQERASKPGAVAIPAEEAARLDQRIAEKRAGSAKDDAPDELNNMEKDVVAKQRGKPSAGTPSKPGAYAESSSQARAELSTLESDVAAKRAAAGSRLSGTATPGARAELNSLEDAVNAKTRREAPSTSVPGACAELTSLEDAVSSKVRREGAAPGARAELNSLEDAVSSKVRREGTSTVGARAELTTLEDRVSSKVRGEAGPGARAELMSLEDAVSSKVRGAASSGPGARAELNSLDEAVASKTRREASSAPGARAELNSFENAVATKTVESSSGHSQLNAMEADLEAKQNAVISHGRVDEISRLDERISAKTQSADTDASQKNEDDVFKNDDDVPTSGDKSKMEDAPPMEQAPQRPGDKIDGDIELNGASPPITTTDQGIVQEPDLEFGVYGAADDGLAVAHAVEEEEDDAFIPSAVEFDPDAKPPMFRNRRFRLYAFLGVFVLVAVGIGAAVGITAGPDDEYTGPTSAPTSYRESLGIRTQVERVAGIEELDNANSPYAKALKWIIYEDPMQLEPDAPNFMQRYVTAYFYYATTVGGPWRSCNPPQAGEDDYCQFQKLINAFPPMYKESPWTRWLSGQSECEWAGIFCDDDNQIRAIELNGANLSGPFPAGITNLPFLQSITMAWGDMRGPLPPELLRMKHLVNVELHYNKFTGQIPAEWWQARNLVRVNIGKNLVEGPIPPEISQLKDIKGIFFFENMLSGELPGEIGDLKSLTYARLSRNLFDSTLPTEIGNLKSLTELWLHRNSFSGSIPTEVGTMESMQDFRVHYNDKLGGEIPTEIYSLGSTLNRIDVHYCNFSGSISTLIGQLSKLIMLGMTGNKFSGPIPTEMGQLTWLNEVYLDDNDFTGSIPQDVCSLRGTKGITDLVADCGGDTPEINCTCCTKCCEGDVCLPTLTD